MRQYFVLKCLHLTENRNCYVGFTQMLPDGNFFRNLKNKSLFLFLKKLPQVIFMIYFLKTIPLILTEGYVFLELGKMD